MYVHLVPPQAAGIVIFVKAYWNHPSYQLPTEGVETSQHLGAVVAPLSRGKKKTLTGSPKSARSKKWIR